MKNHEVLTQNYLTCQGFVAVVEALSERLQLSSQPLTLMLHAYLGLQHGYGQLTLQQLTIAELVSLREDFPRFAQTPLDALCI